MHINLPTQAEISELLAVAQPSCVTLYRPTTPLSQQARGDRIAFKNQAEAAVAQLRAAGASREDIQAIATSLDELEQDYTFWALQANCLAVFATPDRLRTFRLPNRLPAGTHVGDRFTVMPLLRATSFPQAAMILALSQNACRVLELTADGDVSSLDVSGLPGDLETAVGRSHVQDPSQMTHLLGAEGDKVRMRQYARLIDAMLRSVTPEMPLILAAASPLDSIYRSVATSPQLVDRGITGNPDALSDNELAEAARPILDELRDRELEDLRQRLNAWTQQGRGLTDLGDVARAATVGAVDTLLVDIESDSRGVVDDGGAVTLRPDGYSITDEIARRTLDLGGRVLAVRGEDLQELGAVAALLRHRLTADAVG